MRFLLFITTTSMKVQFYNFAWHTHTHTHVKFPRRCSPIRLKHHLTEFSLCLPPRPPRISSSCSPSITLCYRYCINPQRTWRRSRDSWSPQLYEKPLSQRVPPETKATGTRLRAEKFMPPPPHHPPGTVSWDCAQ